MRELFGLDSDPAPVQATERGSEVVLDERPAKAAAGVGAGDRREVPNNVRSLRPVPAQPPERTPLDSFRIGTRGSPLARAQAEEVAALLGRMEGRPIVEIEILRVSGRRGRHRRGPAFPPTSRRWVDAIEQALLEERIDLAVHSAKDVPGELAPGLELLGRAAREPPEDVICGASSLVELPAGAQGRHEQPAAGRPAARSQAEPAGAGR